MICCIFCCYLDVVILFLNIFFIRFSMIGVVVDVFGDVLSRFVMLLFCDVMILVLSFSMLFLIGLCLMICMCWLVCYRC